MDRSARRRTWYPDYEDLGERPAASIRSALSPAAGTPDDRPGTDQRLTLRPVAEDELALIGRFISDPSATGRHEWYGWQDPAQWRRRPAC